MGSALFLLALVLQNFTVSSAYIVTQYVQISIARYGGYKYTQPVTPTGTPTNGLSTYTDTTSIPEVTVVNIVLEATATSYDYYASTSSYSSSITTDYVVPVTYSPASNCSQTWTHVTKVPITLPAILQGVITPVGIATTTEEYIYFSSTSTGITATLAPTDVPSSLLSSASLRGKPYDLTSCATPSTACYTSPRMTLNAPRVTSCSTRFISDYDDDSSVLDDSSSTYDSYIAASGRRRKAADSAWRRYVLIVVLVAVGWTVLWVFVGIVQSWQSFSGLMMGQRQRRGTPYAWGFVSCWCFCFMGPTYKAKSEEEQEILKARWLEMKFGEKLKLYLKWGMRWAYPDVLGSVPEVDKKAWRSRMFSG